MYVDPDGNTARRRGPFNNMSMGIPSGGGGGGFVRFKSGTRIRGKLEPLGMTFKRAINILKSPIKSLKGKNSNILKSFFKNKNVKQIEALLKKNFGPAKSVRPGAKTFYDPKTGRSFNVHKAAGHRGGKPHVDIRQRGTKFDLKK